MRKSGSGLEDLLFDESFIRYVLGKSPADKERWDFYIRNHPKSADLVLQAREIITFISLRHTQAKHPDIGQKIFERLQKQIHAEQQLIPPRPLKASFRVYWYAASVILLVAFSSVFLLNRRADDGFAQSQFLEMIVPEGQRSQVILPDGSKVWLNAGTRFKYPVNFLVTSREVYLSGEAYFEVTHTKNNLPFLVHLKDEFSIRVLGTEFNVKSYETEKTIETTLVKGSIRIIREGSETGTAENLYLKPNEKAVYTKESGKLIISSLALDRGGKHDPDVQADPASMVKPIGAIEAVTAWKNDELAFQDEPFEDIAVRMGRWFGMKITINDESLRKERFTGKFVNNESIYQILDIFNRSESIQYSTNKKEIIIMKKKNGTSPKNYTPMSESR